MVSVYFSVISLLFDDYQVLQQMPARHGPDEFFSFPGYKSAAMSLPPMSPSKWPYQLGWSFSTWICLDPYSSVSVDQEKPFVFW